MSIIEHPLIRKYFGCQCHEQANMLGVNHIENCSERAIRSRLLMAMEEPIGRGEKVLHWFAADGAIKEEIYEGDAYDNHPRLLRIPSIFQDPVKAERHSRGNHICSHGKCCQCLDSPPKSEYEIERLGDQWGPTLSRDVKEDLRHLVRIAKEER